MRVLGQSSSISFKSTAIIQSQPQLHPTIRHTFTSTTTTTTTLPHDLEHHTRNMTTFAARTFSASSYAASRPSYPPALYESLLSTHTGARNLALDLGCGHGLVSRALAPSFAVVLGTDPSAGMVSTAVDKTPQEQYPNVSFRQLAAEDVSSYIGDGEVDLVACAQAAHWVDWQRAWPALARVVRPGGTVHLWGYKDHVFVEHARATAVMLEWAYGVGRDARGRERLAPHWEPGRTILRDLYRGIVPPGELFEEVRREEYEPGTEGPGSGKGEVYMRKNMTVADVMAYTRTWSSYHNWQKANGEPVARKDGGEGDIVDEMFDEIRETEGWTSDEKEVLLEWSTVVISARKK